MDWDAVQKVLTPVLFVVVLIASGAAGAMFISLRTLRESNEDLRNRVGDIEKERADLRADVADKDGRIRVLESVVTGEVHWAALTDQLEAHHKFAVERWDKTTETLAAIREALEQR